MDLDDLLEDLVEDVADAARRRVRRVGREASRRTQVARRRVRRAARAGGLVVAAVFGALSATLALAGAPGGVRLFAAALAALVALTAGGVALAAHRAERRDPRSRASRARRRRTRLGRRLHARRRGRAGRRTRTRDGREATDEIELAEVSQVHPDVQDEWERLLQARRLVRDLTADGWIVAASGLEVDSDVLRLYQLLVADARTARLGGRSAPQLHRQVGELADLLVALADEAVRTRVLDAEGEMTLPATLADAQDHLVALRTARQEVEQIDRPRRQRGV